MQKKTYGDLLARREAATMGVDVQDTGGAQFRIIDPPRVSPQPVAPTRARFARHWPCIVALAAGLLASFVANELMPTFHDARSLRELGKRPILGMVSMLPNPSRMRRKRRECVYCSPGASAV